MRLNQLPTEARFLLPSHRSGETLSIVQQTYRCRVVRLLRIIRQTRDVQGLADAYLGVEHPLRTGCQAINLGGATGQHDTGCQMMLHPLLTQLLLQLQNFIVNQIQQFGVAWLNDFSQRLSLQTARRTSPTLGTSTFSSLLTIDPSAQPCRTLIASASVGGVPKA